MTSSRTRRRTSVVLGVLAGLFLISGIGLYLTSIDTPVGDIDVIEGRLTMPPRETAPRNLPGLASEPYVAIPPSPIESNAITRLEDIPPGEAAIPVGLRIGSLEVDAPIAPYGINERTGLMAVPGNVGEVAWYRHGPAPGEAGSAVLAAHVDLAGRGPGVFFRLRELQKGENVVVTYRDGSEMSFEVIGRVTYHKDALPLDVVFSETGSPVLTLITCGGGFDPGDQHYDSNVVVYAAPRAGFGTPHPPTAS